jgi:Fe-S-cluster containining protein
MSDAIKPCGDCSLCCKLLGVAALDKPAGKWCAQFLKGGGCGVYRDRPDACSTFQCLWSESEKLDERWRPDRCGFILFTEQDGRRLNVVVDPAYPMAWREAPYYERLKKMSERAKTGHELLVSIGDRRIVVFPDHEADLGLVKPEHKIISGYAVNDQGMEFAFAVVGSDQAVDQAASDLR